MLVDCYKLECKWFPILGGLDFWWRWVFSNQRFVGVKIAWFQTRRGITKSWIFQSMLPRSQFRRRWSNHGPLKPSECPGTLATSSPFHRRFHSNDSFKRLSWGFVPFQRGMHQFGNCHSHTFFGRCVPLVLMTIGLGPDLELWFWKIKKKTALTDSAKTCPIISTVRFDGQTCLLTQILLQNGASSHQPFCPNFGASAFSFHRPFLFVPSLLTLPLLPSNLDSWVLVQKSWNFINPWCIAKWAAKRYMEVSGYHSVKLVSAAWCLSKPWTLDLWLQILTGWL